MGVHENIGYEKFPKQGSDLNRRVNVCFNYNLKEIIGGVVVRDDREQPHLTIIKLDDGRYVLATECQYSLDHTAQATKEEWPELIAD